MFSIQWLQDLVTQRRSFCCLYVLYVLESLRFILEPRDVIGNARFIAPLTFLFVLNCFIYYFFISLFLKTSRQRKKNKSPTWISLESLEFWFYSIFYENDVTMNTHWLLFFLESFCFTVSFFIYYYYSFHRLKLVFRHILRHCR